MADYSYITRALLGLGPSDNLRYRNGLAVGVKVETASPTSMYHNVEEPSHVFLDGQTTGTTTDLYLPGYNNGQGVLVDGVFYSIKNIASKPSSMGSNYIINVKGKIDNSTQTIIQLYEQDAVQLVYAEEMFTWYIISKYSEWWYVVR